MADRKVQLEIGVDSAPAKQGFGEISASASQMAQTVNQAGQSASAGVSQIGDGSEGAAQKLDRSTRSIISSVQRTTAAMESGGRETAKYYELLAQQRGANVDALKPYLDRLNEVQARQQAATAGLDRMGVSAAQTAAALRGVPAQFTDIFVSLAAGQPPMMVLLQQGGQLKDMFGGAGEAAKALGGYIAGLITPFTVLAAAAGALAVVWMQGNAESAAYAKALALTGNAAGVTADQLEMMARNIDQVAGTQSNAAGILVEVAKTGKVAATEIEAVATAIAKMGEQGGNVEQLVREFAKIGEDPVKGLKALNEQYNFLTPAILDQVRALQEQGREEEAVKLAQQTAAQAVSLRADEVKAAAGVMERAWQSVAEMAGKAWNAMKNVGREQTIDDQIGTLSAEVQRLRDAQRRLAENGGGGLDVFQTDNGRLEAAERELQQLYDRKAAIEAEAEARRKAAESFKQYEAAADAIGTVQERGIKQTQTLAQALDDYRAKLDKIREQSPDSPLLDPAKVAAGEAAIRKSFESQAKSAGAARAEIDRLSISTQAYFAKLIDAELKAQQASRDLAAAGENAALAELNSIREKVIAAEQEAETIGLSRQELAALTRERLYGVAALKEEMVAFASNTEGGERLAETYRRQAEELRKLADINYANTVAKDFQVEFDQAANSIEQSLTDALLRGFESGKDFAENFRDTLKNMFMTLVLRPLIQPVMGSIAGLIAGFMPGSAGAAGGGLGSLGDAVSLGSQLLGGTMGFGNVLGTAAANATGTGISGLLATNGAYGTAGGIMGGIGAALPYLGLGLAAFGLLGGAFKKPSNKSAWGDVDLSSGAISGLDQLDGEKAPSQETLSARDMFLAVLGGFGQNVGADGKLRIDIGSRDGIQAAFNGGELQGYGKDPDSALMGIMDEIIKSATIDPKVIAQWQVLKTSLDGTTKSASDMAEVMALLVNDVSMVDIERANLIKGENESIGQSYLRLADMMGTTMSAGEMWRKSQENLAEQFAALGIAVPQSSEAFGDLLSSIDITTESGRELFKSIADLGDEFLAVARAVEAAMEQIQESTASSIRDIELSILDDKGKYAYFDRELAKGQQDLANAITPQEVAQQAEENRQLIMDSWALVPENLKASLSDQFISLLQENEKLAAERLSVLNPDGSTPAADSGQQDLDDAVARAIESAATTVSEGGDAILAAAELIARAVGGLPDRIVVTIGDSGGVSYERY